MRINWRIGAVALASVLLLGGCAGQTQTTKDKSSSAVAQTSKKAASSKATSSTATSNKVANSKVSSSTTNSSSHKQATTLWDNTKDGQLETFINQWAPTMKQSYTKYNGVTPLKTSVGDTYPADLSKELVNNAATTIGWSPDGSGNNAYNVVAIYNYDSPEIPGPSHITYFFAFHNGQPVVLVDQSRDGAPRATVTQNADLREHFQAIAAGHGTTSTSKPAATISPSALAKDPKLLGVLIYQLVYPEDDLTKELDPGIFIGGQNRYFITNGGPVTVVGYLPAGSNLNYWVPEGGGAYEKWDEHSISMQSLIDKYYTTADQKQFAQRIVAKLPAITGQSN